MFKSLLHSLLTKVVIAALNLLILVISARYLGVSSRGEISIFLLNIMIIQIVNEIFTGYSIVHFTPIYSLKKIIRYGYVFTFTWCCISNFILFLLGKQVYGHQWGGWITSLIVIVHTFNCVILLATKNVRSYNLLSVLQPALLLFGMITAIFIVRDFTFKAFIYPLLLSFAIVNVLSLFAVKKVVYRSTQNSDFRLQPILKNGVILQASLFVYIFANRYSFYLLPDPAKVGLYAAAAALMEAVLIIANSISPILISRVANQQNSSSSSEMSFTLAKVSFFLSLLLVSLLMIIPEYQFIYFLGEAFTGIKSVMVAYAPGILAISFFMPLVNYFSAIGKQDKLLFFYAVGFGATLLLAPQFISWYDVHGAAYSADVTYFIMAMGIFSVFMFYNKLNLKRLFSFRKDYLNIKMLVKTSTN